MGKQVKKTEIGNDYGVYWEEGSGLGKLMGARNGFETIGGDLLGERRISSGSTMCSTLIVKKPNRVNCFRAV